MYQTLQDFDTALATLIVVLIAVAVVLFVRIQAYMENPRRKEINEEWFADFEANLRQRYRADKELSWRMHILEEQFHDPNSA